MPMQNWIWQDFFDRGKVTEASIVVHAVTIMSPQYCGSCEAIRDSLSDFLCRGCRAAAIHGYPNYADYEARQPR